jgi:hypothetical protein
MTTDLMHRAIRPAGAGPRLPHPGSPRFRRGRSAAGAMVLALGGVTPAMADLVIDSGDPMDPSDDLVLEIRGVAGQGMHRSYLIVDFGATGGGAYAWEWRWNPGDDARGATMLLAIRDQTELEAQLGGEDGQGFGIFVENFALPAAGELGDPGAFWSYWTAEVDDVDPGIAWNESQVGASFRTLANGSIDGWYNGFDGTTPAVPVVQVPGPAAAWLLAIAGACGSRCRRRRG